MSKKRHKKLNQEERFYISKRLQVGDNRNQIALDLKRSASTITREVAKNKDPITGLYSVLIAEEKAKSRQKNAERKLEVITSPYA